MLHPNLVMTKDDERALSPEQDGRVDVNDLIERFTAGERSSQSTFAEEALSKLASEDSGDCPICFNEMESPMLLPQCMHQLQVAISDN